MNRYSSDNLSHLFVNQDQEMPEDFVETGPEGDFTDQDAAIMNKQRADFGSQIDRDASGIGAPQDNDAEHNPAQEADTEYKRAVKAVVIADRNASDLKGAFVRLATSDPRTKTHPALSGTVLASGDVEFAVQWEDHSITVEPKSMYALRRR